MSDNTIVVYGPNGPERHKRPNARDLVNGAGYSWHPTVKTTPASYAPFAASQAPDGPAPSQRVLDSVGGKGSAAANAAAGAAEAAAAQAAQIAAAQAVYATPPAPEAEVIDFSADVAVDASDLDDEDDAAPAEEEAPAAEAEAETPARGRGRGGRRGA